MKTIPQQKKTYLDEFSITILSRLKKENVENQNIDNGIDDESVTTIPIENIKSQYEYHYDENDEIDSIIYYKDNWKIELEVESRTNHFLVSLDGRSSLCTNSVRLSIEKAPYSVKVAKRLNHTYFNTLREKLMWGADARLR